MFADVDLREDRSTILRTCRMAISKTGLADNSCKGADAMRYLLAIKGGETLSEADQNRFVAEHARLQGDLTKQGKLVDSNPLRPAAEMVRIQAVKGGGKNVIDGPFTETKELLGGYYVIEAGSRDEAVQWAKRIPLTTGSVEVYEIAKMR
jgi:hypothetical protein